MEGHSRGTARRQSVTAISVVHARVMGALDHVRWIGGGTGAGKTTVARRIAERFDLPMYSCDDTISVHATRLSAASAPLLHRYLRMRMHERWVLRDPASMCRTFPWFQGEGFELILEDLRSLPSSRPILVEGFRLLPHLVGPHLSDPRHAVWLLPTPEFRQAAFAARDGAEAFWLRTTDPRRALENLLERDELFAGAVARDATRHELNTLVVHGTCSVEVTVEALATRFGLLR